VGDITAYSEIFMAMIEGLIKNKGIFKEETVIEELVKKFGPDNKKYYEGMVLRQGKKYGEY